MYCFLLTRPWDWAKTASCGKHHVISSQRFGMVLGLHRTIQIMETFNMIFYFNLHFITWKLHQTSCSDELDSDSLLNHWGKTSNNAWNTAVRGGSWSHVLYCTFRQIFKSCKLLCSVKAFVYFKLVTCTVSSKYM